MTATYTVKQVAEILGYSTNSIYTFLKEKRIKGVRVGRGRFRIPQSELDRLLLISKKSTPPTTASNMGVVLAPASMHDGVHDVLGSVPIENTKLLGLSHLGTLNIFDWFIGTAAIVAGLGLFLFNASFAGVAVVAHNPVFLTIVRIILIGDGIGILVTNLTGQTRSVWHKLFHILLSLLGIGLGVGFFIIGDIDGSVMYGFLGILVLASAFIHLGGAAWFSLYTSLLSAGTVLTLLYPSRNLHIQNLLSWLPFSPEVTVIMAVVSCMLMIVVLWTGYFRSKILFWFVTWIMACWYFVVSFWYGMNVYWSRSFFMLVVGMTSLFVYPWEALAAQKSRRADLFTLGVFSFMFAVLLAGTSAVYLLQVNSFATVTQENTYKVEYAKTMLQSLVTSVQSTIDGVSDNSSFTQAFEKNDLAAVENNERIMYESNNAIHRLVVLDKNGEGYNLYPFGTFDEKDLSRRDYFIYARDEGKPFVSDIFTALTDQSKRQVVTVSTPLYGEKHQFIGVLAASLNLENIGARLQRVAVPQRREYIVVTDSKGRRIIHPNSNEIGSFVLSTDAVRLGLNGHQGSQIGETSEGDQALVVYDQVLVGNARWSIALKSPVADLYQLTDVSTLSLFGVIVAAVVLAGCILQGGFFYQRRIRTGESP